MCLCIFMSWSSRGSSQPAGGVTTAVAAIKFDISDISVTLDVREHYSWLRACINSINGDFQIQKDSHKRAADSQKHTIGLQR